MLYCVDKINLEVINMESKYIKDVAISKFDNEITEIIEQIDDRGFGGTRMVVGIQNESGVIYRQIIAYGLGEFHNLTDKIFDLGFRDLYKDDLTPHKYDSLFVHP